MTPNWLTVYEKYITESNHKLIGQVDGKISGRYPRKSDRPNYAKPLFFEVSPLNPLPSHQFGKS